MRESGDFLPTASWSTLQKRSKLLWRLREFFQSRGFVEVETPLMSADSVVDRHLDPPAVTLFDDPGHPSHGRQMWLQTSPEYGMKRLLAAGAEQIYQVTRAFRAAEVGPLHNPEFTIVEWYRAGDGYEQGMQLLGEFAEAMFSAASHDRVSYCDAFLNCVGVHPLTGSESDLRAAAVAKGLTPPPRAERDDLLNLLLAECVEPELGSSMPVILYDYPASQSALARVRQDDLPVAERFELYYRGVELANGYHELLDGDELRRRNQSANTQRASDGKYVLPEESRLLKAMLAGRLPACAGVALGFDRLAMVALGKTTLAEVMAFPTDRA